MKNIVISILAAAALLFSVSPIFAGNADLPSSFTYPIRRGATLSRIAKDFGVSKKALVDANKGNPNLKSPDKILAGGKLNIPNVYTKKDVENVKNTETQKTIEAVRTVEQKRKTENSDALILKAMLTISSLVLLILMLKYIFNYCDERDLLAEARVNLANAENDLKELRSQNIENTFKIIGQEEQLRHLNIRHQVNREQISALEQAKKEAENLRDERITMLNRFEKLTKELAAKITAGDKVHIQTRANTTIELLVNKVRIDPSTKEVKTYVECPVQECVVNATQSLELKNALSHMTGHSKLLPEVRQQAEPKEENAPTTVGTSQTEGFPTQVVDEPK